MDRKFRPFGRLYLSRHLVKLRLCPKVLLAPPLVRMLAAFPCIQPIMLGQVPVQTVFIDDVARAVALAIKRDIWGLDVDGRARLAKP